MKLVNHVYTTICFVYCFTLDIVEIKARKLSTKMTNSTNIQQ